MATREQMMQALRAADAAGDTEAARRIAEMISRAGAQAPTQAAPAAPVGPPDPEKVAAQAAADKTLYDPTEGMSFMEKALAGAGGRMTELARGAAQTLLPKSLEQKFGLQESIDEAKRLDAPLKSTGGGMVGSALTDVASFALPGGAVKGAAGLASLVPRLASPGGIKAAATLASHPVAAALAKNAAIGGAQTAAFEPVASDETLGEKVAWGAGGGAAGGAAGAALTKVISPFAKTASKQRNIAANLLEAENVPVSLGQRTGSGFLNAVEQGLQSNPLTRSFVTAGSDAQKEAFGKAVAKRLGGGNEVLTAPELGRLSDQFGGAYDDVAQSIGNRRTAEYKTAVADAIDAARVRAEDLGEETPRVTALLRAAAERGNSPENVTGSAYNRVRSNLTKEASAAARRGDSEVAEIARQLRDAEDAEALRQFPQLAKPLADARTKTGILKVLEKPNVLNPEGTVNPVSMANAVRQRNPAGYARDEFPGLGDFGQLAKSGGEVLKPLGPDSGTALRSLTAKALSNPLLLLGGAGGAATYGASQDPGAMMQGGLTLGAASALLGTKTGRKALANTLMKDNPELANFIKRSGRTVGAAFAADEEE